MSKRTALVTGASRGIGKAIAQRLAHDGAHVLLVARGVGELEAVEREIRDSGGSVETVAADVTERARTESIAADVLARHGVLDILVNNAGGNVRQSAEEMPLKTWDQILALCLTAPFQWSRLFASSMREQGFGRIVNIGSVAGMRALSTGAAYATAKAGLEQLTRSLARAWGAGRRHGELHRALVRTDAFDGGRVVRSFVSTSRTRLHADRAFGTTW